MGIFAKVIEPKKSSPKGEPLFSNRMLKALIVPLIIEQILAMMVGMVDTMMMSYAGEAAISGVSLMDMVNGVVLFLFSSLATGGTIVVSQYIGNKELGKGRRAASQLFMFAVLLGLVLMGLVLLWNRGLLELLFGRAEEAVLKAALTYLVVTAFSYPFLAAYNACAALFRAMGNSKITMIAALMMNILNVIGNSIAIFVLHAGVLGVAISSLFSRMVAAGVLFVLLLNRKQDICLNPREIFTWDGPLLWRILRIAVPSSLENSVFQICRVLQTSIIAMFGTAQIAANGVAISLDNINNIIMQAVSLAIPTVVGRCVGARDYDQADYFTRKMMRIAVSGTLMLDTVVVVMLPLILKLYALSPETIHYIYILVWIHAAFSVTVSPFSGCLNNAIRASGDVKYTMYATIFATAGVRLPLSYVFGVWMGLGIVGMWIAMVSQWCVQAAFGIPRFLSGKWRSFRAIE